MEIKLLKITNKNKDKHKGHEHNENSNIRDRKLKGLDQDNGVAGELGRCNKACNMKRINL